MKEPNAIRWAGVCAGGYIAAAAVYLGNILVLAFDRSVALPLVLAMLGFPAVSGLMGGLVLSGRQWVPRWAVVVAAGFSAIHLVGLAKLFFDTPASIPDLTRSLQWQLGVSFLFLWLGILLFAFRLAKHAGPPTACSPGDAPGG